MTKRTMAGHGGDRRSRSRDTTLKTLADYGITRDQSSKWQRLAEIPDDEFEAMLAKPGRLPSAESMLRRYQNKLTVWNIAARWLAARQ